ncbi:MAG: putative protein N(5)-glutamine methyltransferase [Jatrophihabitantaceae bacterium]
MPDEDELIARLRAAGCVFAEDEARVLRESARSPEQLDRMLVQRVGGIPLEHIVGWAEFRGLRIAVEPGVFVPRRRTEFLVDRALAVVRPGAVVVDMCCGSGAIGAALLTATTVAELHAVEIDPAAVRCARRNLEPSCVHEGDLFDALPPRLRGRIDLIVANAPYVPKVEIAMMPSEARNYEHRIALDGGDDGLDVQRRVVAAAPEWLAPGGHLLIETSVRQAPVTSALMTTAGFTARTVDDLQLAATVVIGRSQRAPDV